MKYLLGIVSLLGLFLLNLSVGAVDIPLLAVCDILAGQGEGISEAWRFIVIESRLPAAITAVLAGMALAVSGLLLQTVFRNPLAGPSVFGINSGSSLAVSLLMMSTGSTMAVFAQTIGGQLAVILAAVLGSLAVLLVIIALSYVVRSNVMLLIVGLMIGYITSSVISILSYFSSETALQAYTIWGLGTFANTTFSHLSAFAPVVVLSLLAAFLYVKPLNAMMMGENYATNMGYDVHRVRNSVLIVSCVLAGVVTAFCGPISFLGLAIPHIARLGMRTDDHFRLLPMTVLAGGNVSLLCNLIAISPLNSTTLPINAITPLVGAPIIIWIILRK